MSAFDQTNESPATTEESEEVTSYLERLVKDRGDNWKDPEVLAKGKIEADRFIEDLKRQNEELRKDLQREDKLDNLIELIKSTKATDDHGGSKTDDHSDEDRAHNSGSEFSEEKIAALIKQHIAERETETTREKNVREVQEYLDRKYDDGGRKLISSLSSEIGMSKEELKGLAASNPKAFLRLVGDSNSAAKQTTGNIVGSSSNTEAVIGRGDVRDWNYYQNLRRTKKTLYHSPQTQKQMLRDREALGEDRFYGRG
jgi:hypothetical protein